MLRWILKQLFGWALDAARRMLARQRVDAVREETRRVTDADDLMREESAEMDREIEEVKGEAAKKQAVLRERSDRDVLRDDYPEPVSED